MKATAPAVTLEMHYTDASKLAALLFQHRADPISRRVWEALTKAGVDTERPISAS